MEKTNKQNLSQVLKSVLTWCHAGEGPRSCYHSWIYFLKKPKKPPQTTKKTKTQSSRTSSVTPQRGQAPWRDFQAPPTCKVAISAEKRLWESKTPNSEGSRVIPVITSAWGAQGDAHPLISVKLPSLIWIINRFFFLIQWPCWDVRSGRQSWHKVSEDCSLKPWRQRKEQEL